MATTTAEYIVLYTHQKQKKAKVWQDGVLKYAAGGDNKKATLFDDSGNRLEQVHIKSGKVEVGDDLESARHLITIEEEKISSKVVDKGPPPKENWFAESKRPEVPATKPLIGTGVSSARGRGGGLPRTGLLRKRTTLFYNEEGNRKEKASVKSGQGFNPPRLVKKPRLEVKEEANAPTETPAVPSRTQSSSNLFSLYSNRRPAEDGNEKLRDQGQPTDIASIRSKDNQAAPSQWNLVGLTQNLGETSCNVGAAFSRIDSVSQNRNNEPCQTERGVPSFGRSGLRTSKQLTKLPGPEQMVLGDSAKETMAPPIPVRRNKSQILALIGSKTKFDNHSAPSNPSDQLGRTSGLIQHKSPREKIDAGPPCINEIQNWPGLDEQGDVSHREQVTEKCPEMHPGAREPGLHNIHMVPNEMHLRVDTGVSHKETHKTTSSSLHCPDGDRVVDIKVIVEKQHLDLEDNDNLETVAQEVVVRGDPGVHVTRETGEVLCLGEDPRSEGADSRDVHFIEKQRIPGESSIQHKCVTSDGRLSQELDSQGFVDDPRLYINYSPLSQCVTDSDCDVHSPICKVTSDTLKTTKEGMADPNALIEAMNVMNRQHIVDLACTELASGSCVFKTPGVNHSRELELVSESHYSATAVCVLETDLPSDEKSLSSNEEIRHQTLDTNAKGEEESVENSGSCEKISPNEIFSADLGLSLQSDYEQLVYSESAASLVSMKCDNTRGDIDTKCDYDTVDCADRVECMVNEGISSRNGRIGVLEQEENVRYLNFGNSQSCEEDSDSRLVSDAQLVHLHPADGAGERTTKRERFECDSERLDCSQGSGQYVQEGNVQSSESQSEQWTQDTFGTSCTLGEESQSVLEDVDSAHEKGREIFAPVVVTIGVGDHDSVLQKRDLALRRPIEMKSMGLGSSLILAYLPGENMNPNNNSGANRAENLRKRDIDSRRQNSAQEGFESLPQASHTRVQASVQEGSMAKFGMMELGEHGGLFRPLSSQTRKTLPVCSRDDPASQRTVHPTYFDDASQPPSESRPRVGERLKMRMADQNTTTAGAMDADDGFDTSTDCSLPMKTMEGCSRPSLVQPSQLKPTKSDNNIAKEHQTQNKESLDKYTPRWSKSGAVVRRTTGTAVPVDRLPQVHEQPHLIEGDLRMTDTEPSRYCLDFNSKQVVNLSEKLNFFMQKSEFNFSANLSGFQSSASSPGQEVPLANEMLDTQHCDHESEFIHHVPEEVPFDSGTQEQANVFNVPDVPTTKERRPLKSKPFDDEQSFDTYGQSQAISQHEGSELKEETRDIPRLPSTKCHDQSTSGESYDKNLQRLLRNFQEDLPSVPPPQSYDSPELFTQDFDDKCVEEVPLGLHQFQGINPRSQCGRAPVMSPPFDAEIGSKIKKAPFEFRTSVGRNQLSGETKRDMDIDISLDSDDLNVPGFHSSQSQNVDRLGDVRSRPTYSSIPSLRPRANNFSFCDFSEKENTQNEMNWRLGRAGSDVQNNSMDSFGDYVPMLRYPNTNRTRAEKDGGGRTDHASSKWDRYNRSDDDGVKDKLNHYHGRFSPPKQHSGWRESSSSQIEKDTCDVANNLSRLNTHQPVKHNLRNVHDTDQCLATHRLSSDQPAKEIFYNIDGTHTHLNAQRNLGPADTPIKSAPQIQSFHQTPSYESVFDKPFAPKTNSNSVSEESHRFAPSSGGCYADSQNFASRQKASSFSSRKSPNSDFRSPWIARQSLDTGTHAASIDSPDIVSPIVISDDQPEKPWIEEYRKNKEETNRKTSQALAEFRTPVMAGFSAAKGERRLGGELAFPSKQEVESKPTPVRQVTIQTTFPSVPVYKQVITSALTEHLNTALFTVSKTYHHALEKADVSKYIPSVGENTSSYSRFKATALTNNNPLCEHGQPSKIVQVRKDGKNKGRFFFSCNAARNEQCKYFKWADELKKGGGSASQQSKVCRLELSDPQSINTFFKGQSVRFYCECQFLRKGQERRKSWARKQRFEDEKKKFYLKLSRKEGAGSYSKDDLWIVSRDFSFEPDRTFIAKSSFYGPNSSNEVQIDPVVGFSSSKWPNDVVCHAILACNAASEFTCMSTIHDHIETKSPPILSHLIQLESLKSVSKNTQGADGSASNRSGFTAPRVVTTPFQQLEKKINIPQHLLEEEVMTFTVKYHLNVDQASALRRIADMFDTEKEGASAVQLIHGVFGAGKSYLLAVLVMFLDAVFSHSDSHTPGVPFPWKILISSTTNVAVDRILMGLLDMGYEDFVRVGSVKKIAKPVLPHSVHASGTESQELKDLQDMLRSQLTPSDKHCVRKSIEQHRLGRNKKKLTSARVVGVTCAACPFPCMDKMVFPVVFLDECSQITEPSSLLPIARFKCEKLVLIGDPKQLGPTLQGSEAAHMNGLEQTLFDRLLKMGYDSALLRTQYRCHPRISAISNALFYNNQLIDGIEPATRPPILPDLPTSCFYNVSTGREQCEGFGSFYNETEVQFVIALIEMLLMSGVEPASIGVITLYRAQMVRLGGALQACSVSDHSELKSIQISTVDAFQGGEKDIIILSCVRTQAVGFIDSEQRTNVALTRAKNHLLIVGNMKNLGKNILWGKIIQHCRGYPNGVQESNAALAHFKQLLQQQRSEEQAQANQSGRRKRRLKKTSSQVVETPEMSQVSQMEDELWDDAMTEVPVRNQSMTDVTESPAMSLDSPHVDMSLIKPTCKQRRQITDKTESPVISLDSPDSDVLPAKRKQKRRHAIDASLFNEDYVHKQDSDEEDLPEFLH